MTQSQQIHASISQIASIRLQTELLQLNLQQGQTSDQTMDQLNTIVALTETVQETLTNLLVDLREAEG